MGDAYIRRTILRLIVLGIFAYAFILLLGEAVGSMTGAAFIVGGVYLMAVVILFLLRKKLFRRMFTNLFSGIIKEESPTPKCRGGDRIILLS